MELIDPRNGAEIFFDGIHEVRIARGIVRIVLFRHQNGTGVIEGRLKCPLSELPDVIQALVVALSRVAKKN